MLMSTAGTGPKPPAHVLLPDDEELAAWTDERLSRRQPVARTASACRVKGSRSRQTLLSVPTMAFGTLGTFDRYRRTSAPKSDRNLS
jgi:hypothetical protein